MERFPSVWQVRGNSMKVRVSRMIDLEITSSRMIGFTNIIFIGLIRFYSKNINASHPSQP